MNIQTPLGKDVLLLSSFTAEEEISKLYSIVADLVHEGPVGSHVPNEVDPSKLLGKSVTIEVIQNDGTKRHFNGIVNRFEQRNRDDRFTHYQMEIVPQLWLLSQVAQSRTFQQMSVPEILKDVFAGLNFAVELQGKFEKRNYCVQYRETDLDFAMRLMEEEGIFFYFEHSNGSHKVIIGNNPSANHDCPSRNEVTFSLEILEGSEYVPAVREWIVNHRLQSGKVTFWDHSFELPFNKLDASGPSRFALPGKEQLEIYDYPGGYAQRFDGIDKSGGEQPSELNKVFQDNARSASLAMEAIDSRYKVISGVSDCSSLTAGHRFNLKDHPLSSNNAQYVLTSVTHTGVQTPDYVSENVVLDPYDNAFTCIPTGMNAPTFRPERITPRPIVQGSQTATVVGPSGEEIFVDKYGRVKVQFHWDRHGTNDAGSSCWVRVAQLWAGNKWGAAFWPRIGQEVIVDFIEGDPDRPIITGCVYNAENMPPYTLPDEKTKSTIKTNSSKGGNGFNEIRFEDKAGSEQIFIHAQKNQDVRVKKECFETIGASRHLIVGGDQLEKIGGDKGLTVSGDHCEDISGLMSLLVGGDVDVISRGSIAVGGTSEVVIKSKVKVIIEAPQVSLKGAGGFVDVGPAGVTIKGAVVMINSGGAAGMGDSPHCSPPGEPTEADTADAGKAIKAPVPPPSPPTGGAGAAANALQQASSSGSPFVAV